MLLENYGIRPLKIGYDRYSAQNLITDMANYGFHMDDVFKGENLLHPLYGSLRVS